MIVMEEAWIWEALIDGWMNGCMDRWWVEWIDWLTHKYLT